MDSVICITRLYLLLQSEINYCKKFLVLLFCPQILPCIRLETANNFLNKLTQFLMSKERTARSLGDVRLLLFAVTLLQNITLDFLLLGCGGKGSGGGEGWLEVTEIKFSEEKRRNK